MKFHLVGLHTPLALILGSLTTMTSLADEIPQACHSGAYRLESGEFVVFSPSDEGALRYRLLDGRSGRLYPETEHTFHGGPGWAEREPRIASARFESCTRGVVHLELKDGPRGSGRRMPLKKSPTSFSSLGNNLYGELHAPARVRPKALVVLAYGSGNESATTFNYLQHLLPIYDIATFVFDKRGTGRSSGRYTADFSALADDTLAAIAHARRLLGDDSVPVGVLGESQGGWVAPLTASRGRVDFVIVSFGLAISPLDEDREEVLQELRLRGHDEQVMAKARDLTQITRRILLSRFTVGLDELAQFKQRHAGEAWLAQVEGDFTGPLLRTPAEELGALTDVLSFDIILDYDARAALERVETPMLWIVAGQDTEAPSAPTLMVLKELQARPTQLDIAIFPKADHGIIDMEGSGAESRLTGHSPGYFDLLRQWIWTREMAGKFGEAVLVGDGVRR